MQSLFLFAIVTYHKINCQQNVAIEIKYTTHSNALKLHFISAERHMSTSPHNIGENDVRL